MKTLREMVGVLDEFRSAGSVAAYSLDTASGGSPKIRLEVVGPPSPDLSEFLNRQSIALFEISSQAEIFHLLGGELRPGSGIVRSFSGRPEGPGGTLTCFLSSRDGRNLFFVAAGHVVSKYWEFKNGSVYRRRQGYPGTDSSRFLGEIFKVSDPPIPRDSDDRREPSIDVGIVELKGRFELKARTTCYGSMGEWVGEPKYVKKGDSVMKCGAEETHWTTAEVYEERKSVWVYGPDKPIFRLNHQIILSLPGEVTKQENVRCSAQGVELAKRQGDDIKADLPENSPRIPFAVAGDSGTMVVDSETKRPIGMLIAGDIIAGRYVVTPFAPIQKYWSRFGLVLLRG
jgi:hypothetical protein